MPRVRIRHVRFSSLRGLQVAAAGRILLLGIVVLLLQSIFWTARVPLTLKVVTAALGVLAVTRPGDALLAVTGLLPFTYVVTTRVWQVHPLALAEAFVLAFLAGYLVNTWRSPHPTPHRTHALETAAWVFAVVVLASCAVQLTIVQVWHDYPLAFARTFLLFLLRDYLTTVPDPRPWVEGHGFVATGALILEGVAVLLATRTLCRRQPALERAILQMAALGGAGAAIVNLSVAAQAMLGGQPILASTLAGDLRWATFIPSLNSSAAYFILTVFSALAVAAAGPRRTLPTGAAVLGIVAMWMTNTRSATVATAATLAAGLIWWPALRLGKVSVSRGVFIAATVTAVVVGILLVAVNPLGLLGHRAYPWLYLRTLLAQTAFRMWAAHPLFGVGIGQSPLRFREFAPKELLRYHDSADPHNFLLWMAAEFGLVGLAAFLWVLGAALAQIWARLRADPHDLAYAALAAGLFAFLVTWLSGQPMNVPIVAYTFWIVLGAAANPRPPQTAVAPAEECRPDLKDA